MVSKLLERLVARQLTDYLSAERLLPDLQSAYRAYHSTETALLKVLSDILRAVDSGDLAVLTLLDLSAAFDTVDHATLLHRLAASYGLGGSAISWFKSYLENRAQYICCRTSCSAPTRLLCGGSARIGPRADPVPTLHSRVAAADPGQRSSSAPVR